jgi:hypothetical protein
MITDATLRCSALHTHRPASLRGVSFRAVTHDFRSRERPRFAMRRCALRRLALQRTATRFAALQRPATSRSATLRHVTRRLAPQRDAMI